MENKRRQYIPWKAVYSEAIPWTWSPTPIRLVQPVEGAYRVTVAVVWPAKWQGKG